MHSVLSALMISAVAAGALSAVDAMQADVPALEAQMRALPAIEPSAPRPLSPPSGQTLAPGVAFLADQAAVILDGRIEVDQGPVDGLEVLIALAGGKPHEALVALPDDNGELLNLAFTIAMNLPDGRAAPEGSLVPAVGMPVRLQTFAQPDPAV